MKLTELEAVIESYLFLSGEAAELSALAQVIAMDKATTKAIVRSLSEKYVEESRGLRILELDGCYQMATAPEYFSYLRGMVQASTRQGMTQSLLETMAIIAYKQPITKGQIEEIRGVSADHAVNKLLEKGLIMEKGRLNVPGKPILFGTTKVFLRHFGFRSLEELPVLKEPDETGQMRLGEE